MRERLSAFEQFYSWVASEGLVYFRSRITQARVDSDQGLAFTMNYCNTRELQEEAVKALSTKCDILWTMLDAMFMAYGEGLEYTVKAPALSSNGRTAHV